MDVFWSSFNLNFICEDSCQEACWKQSIGCHHNAGCSEHTIFENTECVRQKTCTERKRPEEVDAEKIFLSAKC